MQSIILKKWTSLLVTTTATLLLLANPLVHAASYDLNAHHKCDLHTTNIAKSISDYLSDFPWVGLIMDEITYGPITISDVRINKGEKLAVVKPGEILHGHLHYKVDSTYQKLGHRYHLVIGIKDLGAQDCITHTYGIWDSKGKAKFSLQAPLNPGIYEVRFFYQEAAHCEDARNAWNQAVGQSSLGYATIGAIIVE